jgi:hypothetical protein
MLAYYLRIEIIIWKLKFSLSLSFDKTEKDKNPKVKTSASAVVPWSPGGLRVKDTKRLAEQQADPLRRPLCPGRPHRCRQSSRPSPEVRHGFRGRGPRRPPALWHKCHANHGR